MAWCRLGGKPLSEPVMVSLLRHICITQPQWDNANSNLYMEFNEGTVFLNLMNIRSTFSGQYNTVICHALSRIA